MKKILSGLQAFLLITVFMIGCIIPSTVKAADLPRLVDDAGVLSEEEAATLEASLDEVSNKYQVDIVIVTMDDDTVGPAEETADDIFDYNGYGLGEEQSGTLLYVNFATRDCWISTKGYGITAFTDAGIQYIYEDIKDDLSDEFYYDAFERYVSLCDDFIRQAEEGKPYDVDSMPQEPFPAITCLLIAAVIGLIVAAIYSLILRLQLKSVAPNDSAVEYIVPGSMHVQDAGDFFLYRTVTRKEKPKEQESSGAGGSSTHQSSSGSTHGGGGGKF